MIVAALDPGIVIAIVVVAVTIASALVFGGITRSLRGWRQGVTGLDQPQGPGGPAESETLREEVRHLVIAANARRQRRGEEPLDVDAEVERKLRDLEGL